MISGSRFGWSLVAAGSLSLGLALGAADALANGRFPRAQRLLVDEEGGLALFGTYGLLLSEDGSAWSHVCEAATGPETTEDPLLELLPNGRVVLRTNWGLVRSERPGCAWDVVLPHPEQGLILDITRHPLEPSTIAVLFSEYDDSLNYTVRLQFTADGGDSWSTPISIPTEALVRAFALDYAPSDPARIYVTGLDATGNGAVARTDDGGATWQAYPIPGTSAVSVPFLAAVSPLDSEHLFVRTDTLRQVDNTVRADDQLLVSVDGGVSWTLAFSRAAKLLGFALSPDGETVLLGYGDPVLFTFAVEPEQMGIYRIATAALVGAPEAASGAFEQIYTGSITCLRWTEVGLHACVPQAENDFEVGFTADVAFDASEPAPFAARLDLTLVKPVDCQAGSSASICLEDPVAGWPVVCPKLNADCGDTHSETDGGPASGGEDAARTPMENDSGSGPVRPAADGGRSDSGRGDSAPDSKGSSCSCRLVGSSGPGGQSRGISGGWAVAIGLLLTRARRRRPRKSFPARGRSSRCPWDVRGDSF